MTYFTPVIDKYLASWILPDTWHTDQDIEDRFYCFVMAIDSISRNIKAGQLDLDDPILEKYPERISGNFSKIYEGGIRSLNNNRCRISSDHH